MKKGIKEILKEQTKDLLSEDSLNAIEEAFETVVEKRVHEKTQLQVEAALVQQDEDYSNKLEALLEKIDIDMTQKLERVVEAIDRDRAHKLQQVIKKYERALNEEASDYKRDLETNISKFLDVYLEQIAPDSLIKEAVNNKRAVNVLSELRSFLAVNEALSKDSIREAVLDGKRQLTESSNEANEWKQKALALENKLAKTAANLLLEQKTSTMSEDKRKYMKKVLNGKSVGQINENFDYVSDLFDSERRNEKKVLKEQAKTRLASKNVQVVEEKVEPSQPKRTGNSLTDLYISELKR